MLHLNLTIPICHSYYPWLNSIVEFVFSLAECVFIRVYLMCIYLCSCSFNWTVDWMMKRGPKIKSHSHRFVRINWKEQYVQRVYESPVIQNHQHTMKKKKARERIVQIDWNRYIGCSSFKMDVWPSSYHSGLDIIYKFTLNYHLHRSLHDPTAST